MPHKAGANYRMASQRRFMLRYFLTTVIVFSGLLTMSSSGFAQPAATKQVQFSVPSRNSSADRYANARERMVREDIAASGVTDTRVLESMRLTPRHEFVTTAQRPLAYFDMSLPIGERQTISGPFVVAYMTEQLDPKPLIGCSKSELEVAIRLRSSRRL